MSSAATLEDIRAAGYWLEAATPDVWRDYDERDPVPGYFDFDWFSAYHPDLYHRFAISTEGLMEELQHLVDLSDLTVADIGAGTGRAAFRASEKAKQVYAVDAYRSVIDFGRERIRELHLRNVDYIQGDAANIPLSDNSVDVSMHSWAILCHEESYRILKPGGLLVSLGPASGSLCGELTTALAPEYPELITSIASAESFDPQYPSIESVLGSWGGIPLVSPARIHDFTHVADYGNPAEAAAILGRLYGPRAKRYILDRDQSTLAWRLRITTARVAK